MDQLASAQDKRNVYRSLKLLVKGLENQAVIVDLRNESSVSGVINQVDSDMNIWFENAALFENGSTNYKYFESLFLPARMVRDVIIPDGMSVERIIQSMLPKKFPKQEKKSRTFKEKRAMRNQEETFRLIRDAKNAKELKFNTTQ